MSHAPTQSTARSGRWWLLLALAGATAIAVFLALQFSSASLRGQEYHPVGNDAFYHARRIIDTAGERGFYEFDETIHVPEGSQITWPWAYDYLMGKLLALKLAADPDAEPMRFLAQVPPLVLVLNVALFFLLTGAAGLSPALRAVATLAYAMFPFTQILHGVGAIDHHFVEHSFVLASVLLAVHWARAPDSRALAVGLGLTLGVAPAFHNGLFILQLPILLGLGVAWLRRVSPAWPAALAFAITLVAATLAVALPSAPFRAGAFDYSLLSGFHLYVAFCTGVVVALYSRLAPDRGGLVRLAVGALVLAVPILLNAGGGVAFISGDILLFDRIEEAQSPLAKLSDPVERGQMSMLYTALVYLMPAFLLWYAWRLVAAKSADAIVFAACAAFGLLLMSTQIRLQYFGSFAFLLAVPMLLEQYLPRTLERRAAIAALAALTVVAAAWQRPIRHQLFAEQDLGLDVDYEVAVELFEPLAEACAEAPGIALATNNFGHPVRYHSACSVIANNFLLTPQHEDKIRELQAAWALSPSALLRERPDIRYVFVVLSNVFLYTETGLRPATMKELAGSNPPLALALTFNERLPAAYELIAERRLDPDDPRDFAVARLFRIHRDEPVATMQESP